MMAELKESPSFYPSRAVREIGCTDAFTYHQVRLTVSGRCPAYLIRALRGIGACSNHVAPGLPPQRLRDAAP